MKHLSSFSLFCILLTLIFLPACGSKNKSKTNDEAVYQDYGKPGPTEGMSCYVGPAKGAHTCLELSPTDREGTDQFNGYCSRYKGQIARGSCTMDQHVGTCRYMKKAPTLLLRFYNQEWPQAKHVCDGEGGLLEKGW